MNKQLTKKTIGIAASAALMASLAFSGSALAAPGGEKGPPPPQSPPACVISEATHACAAALQGVTAAILGATTVHPRDESTLVNKVCEANFKFLDYKLHDAAQKLTDISETVNSKKKISVGDAKSISDAALEAADKILVSCQTTY
jgi:hypothetical protein